MADAFRREPTEPEITLAEALERDTEGNLNGAIACLEALRPGGEGMRRDLLLAMFLTERGGGDDIERALRLLEPLVARIADIEPRGYRADICRLLLRLCSASGRADEVRRRLDAVTPDTLGEVAAKALQVRLRLAEGNKDDAKRLVSDAAAAVDEQTSWFDRREVATLAHDLELWQTAFSMWKGLVSPRRYGADCRNLLRTAQLAREEGFIIEFCRSLREHGVRERECYLLESDVLFRSREPEQAIALLQDWLQDHPDDLDAGLSLSFVARVSGHSGLAESDPARLPRVAEISDPRRGAAAAFVLRHGDRPETGLAYAYELWRRFPDDLITRHTLVSALLSPQAPPLTLVRPSVVEVGAAVRLQDEEGNFRWMVVEPGPAPSAIRHEYLPDHPFSRAVLGRAAGAGFEYSGRTYRVIAVDHRYVVRAHECLNTFEELFPGVPLFRRFKVNPDLPDDADPKIVLGDLLKELERQEQHRKQLESLHQQQRVPLAVVAQRLGRRVFDTVRHFATSPELTVCCAIGHPEEWKLACAALAKETEVVLDPTATATVYLLSLDGRLRDLPFRLVVPSSVLDEIREAIADAANYREGGGILGSIKGKPFFYEYTSEELTAHVKRLEEFLENLKSACEVVGGKATLSIEGKLRDAMLTTLGPSTTDAIAIAKKRKAVLWTDDLTIGLIAENTFQTRRVWTHAVLRRAGDEGALPATATRDATCWLMSFGYVFTGVSADDIVHALKAANWDVTKGVGEVVLRYLTRTAALNPVNQVVCGAALVAVWAHCPDEQKARAVIIPLLDGIGRAVSGPLIARRMYRLPRPVLGMTDSKMRRFRRMLRRWRSSQPPHERRRP